MAMQDADQPAAPDQAGLPYTEWERRPHLLLSLAESSLAVAESLRGSYFTGTATFVRVLRAAMRAAADGKRPWSPLVVQEIERIGWSALRGEAVAFVDGGFGQVSLAGQGPIVLRVGTYAVRTGERDLGAREHFGYYPVVLGQLEGGSKEHPGFAELSLLVAELLSGLSALERWPTLRALLFHGPLVAVMGPYTGYAPFTERDIDLFLRYYAPDPALGRRLKERFLAEARQAIYPAMSSRVVGWADRRLFEPLAWTAFLYRQLIAEAKCRAPTPIIAGVVERGRLHEFTETVLLERVFRGLAHNGHLDYFNRLYGRSDLTTPGALLDRLGYTDALVLAMLLRPGQLSEPWAMDKYRRLGQEEVSLPGVSGRTRVDYGALRPGPLGFPAVLGAYVCVSQTTEPLRVEVFAELDGDQMNEAARRTYLYAGLLPGYGFPVGLDIADKYARVPSWLTTAYGKLIRYQLGLSLQSGEIDDAEMRRILVQALYMRHRDWLFRPQVSQEAAGR
jgi:hypothetical protein